jgi:hypothetical protein
MLASVRSQNIPVVQAGCSRNAITSESGLGFIGDILSVAPKSVDGCDATSASPFQFERARHKGEIPMGYRFDAQEGALTSPDR